MEKSPPGWEPNVWRGSRPVTRRNVKPQILSSRINSSTNGVLYAKRRRDRLTTVMSLAGLGITLFVCVLLFAVTTQGVRNNMARRNSVIAAAPAAVSTPALVGKVIATGKTNILLLGSDQREGDGGFRTDVILLVSIDADQKTVSVVSFPRDLWVDVPTMYEMKINMVMGLGGFGAMQGLFESNFGVHPDYYLLTNFSGFTGIIDSLGGIDVAAAQSLTDDCDLPQQVDGDCTVDPGTIHMDGPTALWYVRSRKSSSDYDRMRRMQEVVSGMFVRLMSVDAMARVPELVNTYSDSVQTNLKVNKILPLLPIASEVFNDSTKIRSYSVAQDYTDESWAWNGMWILLPNLEGIQGMLTEAGIR